jgi:hypothetical protein
MLNMALFHAESSILNRYLSSPGLDALTQEVEASEMRRLGMKNPDNRWELRRLLRADASTLAEIRRRKLRVLSGRGELDGNLRGVGRG